MWEHIQSELFKVSTGMFNNNKKWKIVNKSAVFWFEFFPKRFVPGARFSKVPVTFQARKAVLCCSLFIQDQSFNNFENNTTKLLVNDAKLTGLWARNWATIQQVLILKFALGPEKFPGVSRNRPLALHQWSYKVGWNRCNVCICHERKKNFVLRGPEETEVGV